METGERIAHARLRVYKEGRGPSLNWYFDSPEQLQKARAVIRANCARIIATHYGCSVPAEDFITDAGELDAYLKGEK